jgi:hypothetical protein
MKKLVLKVLESSWETAAIHNEFLESYKENYLRTLGYEFAKHFAKESIEYEVNFNGKLLTFTTKELLDDFLKTHKNQVSGVYYIRRTFSLGEDDV